MLEELLLATELPEEDLAEVDETEDLLATEVAPVEGTAALEAVVIEDLDAVAPDALVVVCGLAELAKPLLFLVMEELLMPVDLETAPMPLLPEGPVVFILGVKTVAPSLCHPPYQPPWPPYQLP